MLYLKQKDYCPVECNIYFYQKFIFIISLIIIICLHIIIIVIIITTINIIIIIKMHFVCLFY